MEYVQTVLARIAAAKFDEAAAPGGLIPQLNAHRDFASAQPGFLGMSISHTANPEGDVMLVVETRWSSGNALSDYASATPNVATIVAGHEDVLVPDSVQVHRMQTHTTEERQAPSRIYDRMALALFVPLGVLAFALLVIYGLSRIYLTLPNDWATPLAAVIALGILAVAWYFSTHPYLPRWQLGAVVVLALGALAFGGTAAAIIDEGNQGNASAETPGGQQPGGQQPGGETPSGELVVLMHDNYFEFNGEKNPDISIPADQDVTITFSNEGLAIHNAHSAGEDNEYASDFCTTDGEDPCTDPATVQGGQTATMTVNLPPGTYDFRCDFHPDQMNGTFVVE